MKKKFKLVLVCILCGILSLSIFGGNYSVNSTNKVYAAENDGGVIGTANLNGTTENSAKVGDVLKAPEIGWKRYDDTGFKLISSTAGISANKLNIAYNSTFTSIPHENYIEFSFTGSKFRFIAYRKIDDSTDMQVNVDGKKVGTYSEANPVNELQPQVLVYELTGLEFKNHIVKLANTHSVKWANLDAIDIDKEGYMGDKPSETLATGISLNKTTVTLEKGKIDTDTLIATVTLDNATNKTVKWSTSDSNIVTVDNGKVTALKAGTATITAATTDGTNLTATCVVTVTELAPTPEPSKGRAILEVVMSNSERKEYDLAMTEVNKFVDWYNGNTSPSYQIRINNNVKPFNNRTEYLAHDKVSSFEVKEYIEEQK